MKADRAWARDSELSAALAAVDIDEMSRLMYVAFAHKQARTLDRDKTRQVYLPKICLVPKRHLSSKQARPLGHRAKAGFVSVGNC